MFFISKAGIFTPYATVQQGIRIRRIVRRRTGKCSKVVNESLQKKKEKAVRARQIIFLLVHL